jgi:tetratricopeptide (TPR) repeat protein
MNLKSFLKMLTIIGLLIFGFDLWLNFTGKQKLDQVKSQIAQLEKQSAANNLTSLKAMKNQLQEAKKSLEEIATDNSFKKEVQPLQTKLGVINQKNQLQIQALTNLENAEQLAIQASISTQNPPHPANTWSQASAQWQQAVNLLKSINRNTFAYPIAQAKLKNYQTNYQMIANQANKANQSVALNNRAMQEIQSGEYQRAINTLNQATTLNPGTVESYINRGIAYAALGSDQSAIANFNQAIKINPQNIDAYFVRGEQYLEMGNYDQAIADYEQVINLDPNYTNVYLSRGYIYRETNQLKEAIADFEIAAKLSGEQGNLGTQQLALNQIEEIKSQLPNPVIIVQDDDYYRRNKVYVNIKPTIKQTIIDNSSSWSSTRSKRRGKRR